MRVGPKFKESILRRDRKDTQRHREEKARQRQRQRLGTMLQKLRHAWVHQEQESLQRGCGHADRLLASEN